MKNIKMLVVPAWMNSLLRDMDLQLSDLTGIEKLSGILSKRDLQFYRMINSADGMKTVFDKIDAACTLDSALMCPPLQLEEKFEFKDIDAAGLIYGPTVSVDPTNIHYTITTLDQNTLALVFYGRKNLPDEVKADTRHFNERLIDALWPHYPITELAKLAEFRAFVDAIYKQTE